jgi:glutamine amidotransferase
MTSGVVNADGYGFGWYQDGDPYRYRSILPIWNDVNLSYLSRYIQTRCTVAYVRSATVASVNFSDCQPFEFDRLLFVHNGFIKDFRNTLYRPLREALSDERYRNITGTTDSEHIFAFFLEEWERANRGPLDETLIATLQKLTELAQKAGTDYSANLVIADGKQLIASRYSTRDPVPSLYWLRDDPAYPDSVLIASEPLFTADWKSCPENSVIRVGEDLEVTIDSIA